MKNVLDQKPNARLTGRLSGCAHFVASVDLQNKNILDVGCGFGSFALYAVEQGALAVSGTEISEQDIATAQKNISDKKIHLCVGSALALPFADESFDTVVSFDVIEHIPKHTESQMFSEIYRVLKPGGVFYLSTPFRSFFSNIGDPAWWLAGHRHYTQNQLEIFGKNKNFSVEEVQTKGSWGTFFSILNLYISKWIFRRTPFFEKFFLQKETLEYSWQKGFINILVKYKKNS